MRWRAALRRIEMHSGVVSPPGSMIMSNDVTTHADGGLNITDGRVAADTLSMRRC
jgi:hypothetical protein